MVIITPPLNWMTQVNPALFALDQEKNVILQPEFRVKAGDQNSA
jgi:hypothetical protein